MTDEDRAFLKATWEVLKKRFPNRAVVVLVSEADGRGTDLFSNVAQPDLSRLFRMLAESKP